MRFTKFLDNKVHWLILIASSMWLDGITTAYNLTHGRMEYNPLVRFWFDSKMPLGFVLNAALTGAVMYILIRKWDDKEYRYLLWTLLILHMAFSWMFNIYKITFWQVA